MFSLPRPLAFDYFRHAIWPWVQVAVLLVLVVVLLVVLA